MDKAEFYGRISQRPMIDVIRDEATKKKEDDGMRGSNDITLYSFRNIWLKNYKENLKNFGYFKTDHSAKVFYTELEKKPVILVGAGPSLAENMEVLREAKARKITIIACNHAFMYMADKGIMPDMVVALDAQDRWTESFKPQMPKYGLPLLADECCDPEALKSWKDSGGSVFFFHASCPEDTTHGKFLMMEVRRIIKDEDHATTILVGGHTMGAMFSIAKGIMNCQKMIFVGADYCYSPKTDYFYPFKETYSKYDDKQNPKKQGPIPDIFGNICITHAAYNGFKNVMDDSIKAYFVNNQVNNQDVDFEMINATEGGALGAFPEGNSRFMRYLTLEDAVYMCSNKYNKEEKK